MVVSIRALRVEGVPVAYSRGAVVAVKRPKGGKLLQTPKFQGKPASILRWDLQLLVGSEHYVLFKLYRRRKIRLFKKLLGKVKIDVHELEHTQNGGEYQTIMMVIDRSCKCETLRLAIEVVNLPGSDFITSGRPGEHPRPASENETSSQAAVAKCSTSSPEPLNGSANTPVHIMDAPKEPSQSAVKLLKAIEPAVKVLDTIAKFHPIAEIVCCVITGAFKAIKAQNDQDQDIVELYNTMIHVCEITTRDDILSQRKEFHKLFDTIVKLSIDCSLFISNYSSHGYLRRMASITVTQRIDQFMTSFRTLEREFDSIQTHITSTLAIELDDITKRVITPTLKRLEAGGNLDKLQTTALKPRTPCLAGTRLSTFNKLLDWIATGEESILWLSGIAGCGKSSLMASLHDLSLSMGCMNRLGAFIRFDRLALCDASIFVKSLAYKLAQLDSRLANVIAGAVRDCPQVLDHTELQRQLEALVLEPLALCSEIQDQGPIVILVDGLDECNQDGDAFNQLLRIFAENSFQSFPFLRIIIASRPEEAIKRHFRDPEHIHSLALDTNSRETTHDIERFFQVKLDEFSIDEFGTWELCTRENAFQRLAERASGLFIWASTAIKYICVPGYFTERLVDVLNTGIPKDAQSALVSLYRTALDGIVGEDKRLKADVQLVIGSILICKQAETTIPWDIAQLCTQLTPTTLHPLLEHLPEAVRFHGDYRKVVSIVNKLGSILTNKAHGALTFAHKSFDDYITDEGRRGEPWFVDTREHMRDMAYACLSLLQGLLERDPAGVNRTVFVYTGRIWAWVCRAAGPEAIISLPLLHDLFRKMFQRYWMRWVAVQEYCWWKLDERPAQWMHPRLDDSEQWLELLLKCFPDDRDYQSVKLLITPYRLCPNLNDQYVKTRNKCLHDVLDRLCSLNPSNFMYKNYMSSFVQLANQSMAYNDISTTVHGLKADDWIPPLIDQNDEIVVPVLSGVPQDLLIPQEDGKPDVTLILWAHTSYRKRQR